MVKLCSVQNRLKSLSFLFVCFVLFCFQDRVSLYNFGCPGTCSADQAGLELRGLPASASQALGLKACATVDWLGLKSSCGVSFPEFHFIARLLVITNKPVCLFVPSNHLYHHLSFCLSPSIDLSTCKPEASGGPCRRPRNPRLIYMLITHL